MKFLFLSPKVEIKEKNNNFFLSIRWIESNGNIMKSAFIWNDRFELHSRPVDWRLLIKPQMQLILCIDKKTTKAYAVTPESDLLIRVL